MGGMGVMYCSYSSYSSYILHNDYDYFGWIL